MPSKSARQHKERLTKFLQNVERGVLDDRLDSYMPPELYGLPMRAELEAARRQEGRPGGARAKAAPRPRPVVATSLT